MAAACIAAIDVLLEEPEIIDRLWENTRFFKSGLEALGFNTGVSESPDHAGHHRRRRTAMKLSDRLFQEGVFAQGIAFPTVAKDKARVRPSSPPPTPGRTSSMPWTHLQSRKGAGTRIRNEIGVRSAWGPGYGSERRE